MYCLKCEKPLSPVDPLRPDDQQPLGAAVARLEFGYGSEFDSFADPRPPLLAFVCDDCAHANRRLLVRAAADR